MLKCALYLEMVSYLAIVIVLISITVTEASDGKEIYILKGKYVDIYTFLIC